MTVNWHPPFITCTQAKDVNPWNVTYVPVPRKRVDCRNLFEITLLEDKATERLHEVQRSVFATLTTLFKDPPTPYKLVEDAR